VVTRPEYAGLGQMDAVQVPDISVERLLVIAAYLAFERPYPDLESG